MTNCLWIAPTLRRASCVLLAVTAAGIAIAGCDSPPAAEAHAITETRTPAAPSKISRATGPASKQRIASGGRLQREKLRANGEAPSIQ